MGFNSAFKGLTACGFGDLQLWISSIKSIINYHL